MLSLSATPGLNALEDVQGAPSPAPAALPTSALALAPAPGFGFPIHVMGPPIPVAPGLEDVLGAGQATAEPVTSSAQVFRGRGRGAPGRKKSRSAGRGFVTSEALDMVEVQKGRWNANGFVGLGDDAI